MKTTKNQIKELKHLLKNDSHSQHHLKIEITKNILPHIFDKEETYQITKEQILDLYSIQCVSDKNDVLESLFPSVFEEDKKELVVGKWYSNELFLLMYKGNERCISIDKRTGLYKNDDIHRLETHIDCGYSESTTQEIQQALEKECKKIGIVFNATVKAIPDQLNACNKEIYTVGGNFVFNGGKLYAIGYGKVCVFKDGKFATVVKPMTQQQIEKELGYEISII